MTTSERHEKLAAQIREAVSRVVHGIEIGDDGLDLAAVAWIQTPGMSREESLDFERRFVDDLTLAVGEVLTREGE